MKKIFLIIFISFMVVGCKSSAEKVVVKGNPSEVVQQYLDAIKKQDTLLISNYTSSGLGENFNITQEDAKQLGMDIETIKQLFQFVFSFQYEIKPSQQNEKEAKINVTISTYPINETIQQAIQKNEEKFAELFQNKKMSEEEKNKAISKIIVQEFKNAKQSYKKDFVFECVVIGDSWKVKDDNLKEFYKILWN